MSIASRARTCYQRTYHASQEVCDHYLVHALGRRANRCMLENRSAIRYERELRLMLGTYPKTSLDYQGCTIPQKLSQSLRAL